MDTDHSFLPPSGAAAWEVCPLWPTMNALYPQLDTQETLEGNAAHWVAWELLAGKTINEGQPTPNGVIVTDEMIEGADLLIETIEDMMPPDRFKKRNVELKMSISRIHEYCFGTPDVWSVFYTPQETEIPVIDYKFGHRYVDEYLNKQGICYITGILDQMPSIMDQYVKFNFTIVQPRCFYRGQPVRTWSATASELRPYINKLSYAANLALQPNPQGVTNPECRNCPGRGVCPALQKAAYADAEYALSASPVELSSNAASLELRMLERASERLSARVDGLKEMVMIMASQGLPTPYHALERKPTRKRWDKPPEEIIAMGQLMGVDLTKPGVKTPTQAKKLGIDETVINAYSSVGDGSLQLVQHNPDNVSRIFKGN